MPDEAPAPQVPHHAPRLFSWRWLILLMVGAAMWVGFMLGSEKKKPSLTLPDGVHLIYEGSSRGVLQAGRSAKGLPAYNHAPPPQGQRLKHLWQKLRGALPGWIVSRLPAWDLHPEHFPGGDHPHECELRFRVLGYLVSNNWDISVADDKGWENPVHYYIWEDDGLVERGYSSQVSGWLRLGSPYPRLAETLRVRFRPTLIAKPHSTKEERLAETKELMLPNPFYNDDAKSAPKAGAPLPITKPFRDGTITLVDLKRDPVVGSVYGMLAAEFKIEHAGKPAQGFEIKGFSVTDSSGQFFRSTSGMRAVGDIHVAAIDTAPWSDDPCWRLRLQFVRTREYKEFVPEEVFRFEKLPLPGKESVPINREVTRGGITLRLGTLEPLNKSGESRLTVEGWVRSDPSRRSIILQDARDDQGRLKASQIVTPTERISIALVDGPVEQQNGDATFAVRPLPGSKWWDLSVVPETLTEVEFIVQAPTAK